MQSDMLQTLLARHGWKDTETSEASLCLCDHKLGGSGAIFLQSHGLLYCNNCRGYQLIRKPLQ